MGKLVLTRKKGEGVTLYFGTTEVKINITEISGGSLGRVKLTFEAPPNKVGIYRSELGPPQPSKERRD